MRLIAHRRQSFGLLLLIIAFAFRGYAAEPAPTVGGIVIDAAGRPLEGVTVQVGGLEKFRNGAWIREIRLGVMPEYSTDSEGRFLLPFTESEIRYDLWFDKGGFASTFLYGVPAGSQGIKVVLKRGTLLTGTVTRPVSERREPVQRALVELELPSEDLWYRQRAFTDSEGKYTFRISPPPKDRKWLVVFCGHPVEIDDAEAQPLEGPDFEVTVHVRAR